MAFRNLFICFVCDGRFQARQMRRIDGDDNVAKKDIAIFRRDMAGRPALEVTDLTRLCVNCNRSILDEIDLLEQDPTCMRINVLTQTRSASCLICNQEHDVQRLSLQARVNIFITSDIYIPSNVRSCPNHLDGKGFLLRLLHAGLRFINRPYVIKGQELQMFIQELNLYHEPIQMEGADAEFALTLLARSQEVNVVQARVEAENLQRRRRAEWIRLDHNQLMDFPELTFEYLQNLTFRIYQLLLAPSYIQDTLLREEENIFQVDVHAVEPGFIRFRLYSRFRNNTIHQQWIAYVTENDNDDEEENPIMGYYCTCITGA